MAKIINLSTPIYTFKENKKTKQGIEIKYYIDHHECHICISHTLDKDGYPRVFRHGKDRRMSRYVWSEYNSQEIPEGMVVRHTCDKPGCINPEHLKLGTQIENLADMRARNRTRKGNVHKNKLSNADIYYLKYNATETTKDLAKKFHVHEVTIRNIRKGRTWKNVKLEDVKLFAA